MKKSLCLTASLALTALFVFAGNAEASQVQFQQQQEYLAYDLEPYEGGGGGGTIVGGTCASTCGGANTQSACQQGGYVCTNSVGSCWCPTSTPLNSGFTGTIHNFDSTELVTNFDIDNFNTNNQLAQIDSGSGSGTTKKVNGDCPAGTSLSSDKCCCIAN